jgi:uncharacterized OB-fold protein
MPSWLDETESMVYKGRIKVPYLWWVGETGTDFLNAIKDEKKIMGRYCPQCDMTFIPPRKVCGRCFSEDMTWKELSSQGTLVTYTVPNYKEDIHPLPAPFAFAIVKLDGADTGLAHLVADFKEGDLKTGMRVEAVFADERQGSIMDIRYFRPVAG